MCYFLFLPRKTLNSSLILVVGKLSLSSSHCLSRNKTEIPAWMTISKPVPAVSLQFWDGSSDGETQSWRAVIAVEDSTVFDPFGKWPSLCASTVTCRAFHHPNLPQMPTASPLAQKPLLQKWMFYPWKTTTNSVTKGPVCPFWHSKDPLSFLNKFSSVS